MILRRVFSCDTESNCTGDHLFNAWGGLETLTLNMKLGDAYEKMLKILSTSYREPYQIPPTENPMSCVNDDDEDK